MFFDKNRSPECIFFSQNASTLCQNIENDEDTKILHLMNDYNSNQTCDLRQIISDGDLQKCDILKPQF